MSVQAAAASMKRPDKKKRTLRSLEYQIVKGNWLGLLKSRAVYVYNYIEICYDLQNKTNKIRAHLDKSANMEIKVGQSY